MRTAKKEITTKTQKHEGEPKDFLYAPSRLRAFVVKRNGFSLIEMLVVLAVAAILLGLVLTPLVTTFNFTNRARRSVEVQDAARYAMEVMSREIADAMQVVVDQGDYEPFLYYPSGTPGQGDPVVVRSMGYINAYDDTGTVHQLPNAMIDLVLPHDTLGLEGGGVQQPLVAQHQTVNGAEHPIVVRYFVGLNYPLKKGYLNGNVPVWRNNVHSKVVRPQNMYTLYRVEFDPYDPNMSKWAVPDPSGAHTPDGRAIWVLNPNFFYESQAVSGVPNAPNQAMYWRKKSVAIMPTDTMDLVDFIPQTAGATAGPYAEARSLVSFNPLIMPGDAADKVGDDRYPTTYKTQYGHWTGLQNDGTVPFYLPPNKGFNPLPYGMLPRILVYHQYRDPNTDIVSLVKEFDTTDSSGGEADPKSGNRVLAWNSLKGTVEFSLPGPDYENTQGGDPPGSSMFSPLSTLPSGIQNPYITPNSETVTVWERDPTDPNFPGNNSRVRPVVYSRSSSSTKDVYEVPDEIAVQDGAPQQLPPPRTYIVTSAGRIIIGYPYPNEGNPVRSQPVPNGIKVDVSYFYQNNRPDDLVKVDYLTRELVTINMTARMYDPVNHNPIATTLANRVRLRNIQR